MRQIYFLIIVLALIIFTNTATADNQNSDDEIGGEIFGKRGRYIHPSLTIGGEWSDNIFNTKEDKIDDFIWVISPEIWVALPDTRKKAMDLTVSPRTPDGFTRSRWDPEKYRRYQAYLLYGIDIYRHTDFTEEDRESHRLEGLFQYNFGGGFSIELLDRYEDGFDPISVGAVTRRDEYKENLFNAILAYDISEKLELRLDYTHFDLDYENRLLNGIPLAGRNRQDSGYSGYLFFKIRPKTSIFAQYRYIDIDYELDILAGDSQEQHYLGGFEWHMTTKSMGRLKVGYGLKDFDSPARNEVDNFILEGEFHHSFTPKTTLGLAVFRRTDETTIQETDYVLTQGVSANYNQLLTTKLTGNLFASYAWDQYQDEIVFADETREREDRLFRIRPSLRYELTRWLMADAAYSFTKRDSNFDIYDFDENRFSFHISIYLHI